MMSLVKMLVVEVGAQMVAQRCLRAYKDNPSLARMTFPGPNNIGTAPKHVGPMPSPKKERRACRDTLTRRCSGRRRGSSGREYAFARRDLRRPAMLQRCVGPFPLWIDKVLMVVVAVAVVVVMVAPYSLTKKGDNPHQRCLFFRCDSRQVVHEHPQQLGTNKMSGQICPLCSNTNPKR
eukprot:PhM_4_TR2045/c4_g1_i1/m.95483